MTKKNKALAILIGSAIFTSAARFSYSYLRFHEVGLRIHRIKSGATRARVLEVLGEPNLHDGACGEIHAARKGCAREFVYSPPIAALFDDYYVVSFGKYDRVISTDHYNDGKK